MLGRMEQTGRLLIPVTRSFCLAVLALCQVSTWPSLSLAQMPLHTVEVAVPQGALTVRFAPTEFSIDRKALLDWVRRSAHAVALYYGRFPLPKAVIHIAAVDGNGVKGGRAFGEDGGFIRVFVGRESDHQALLDDWVMVHEMIHLAFPRLLRRHNWLSEGLAVYVESIARLQAGDLEAGFVWRGFAEGMKNGLPQAEDKGLDFTPTWGRTYWGGAIFCLVADIEIQKRSNGGRTLRDALRAILSAGGNFEVEWPIEKSLTVGDEATGTTVLSDLYQAWKAMPVDPDLPALWQVLGVQVVGKSARFDDTAALARIRKRIGKPPTAIEPTRDQ